MRASSLLAQALALLGRQWLHRLWKGIFVSIHAEDLIRELKIHAEKLEYELKVAHDYIRGCPIHGTALCPEEYMLDQDGEPRVTYEGVWQEVFRCGRRPPRPILTKENNETNK